MFSELVAAKPPLGTLAHAIDVWLCFWEEPYHILYLQTIFFNDQGLFVVVMTCASLIYLFTHDGYDKKFL
jgi:hypothetical protein